MVHERHKFTLFPPSKFCMFMYFFAVKSRGGKCKKRSVFRAGKRPNYVVEAGGALSIKTISAEQRKLRFPTTLWAIEHEMA